MTISLSFEAPAFFEAIYDKSLPGIQILTQQEVGMTEARSSRVKGAVAARAQGSGDYIALLKGFLFFRGQGRKPYGVSDEDFAMFLPICERLVEKGQFRPGLLEAFTPWAEHE